ncbi:MAG: phytanoyl-CoA dioxygenase family protein [Moorea sp. SIO2B7]|nr:phytanoyl-CoA dioxygenase family protein [Moorena sp. SIO2B7]
MKDKLSLALKDEQVTIFEKQGFLSFDRITTDQEIEWLKEIYDRIVEKMTVYSPETIAQLAAQQKLPLAGGKEILVWIPSPELIFPQLIDAIYFRNALKIAAHLLNVQQTKVIGRVRMYLKPAYFGAEMPWHQDAAYLGSIDSLKIWMPLDPATSENGCLHFIPGSHLGGIKPHRPYEGDTTGSGLIADGVEAFQAVVCPLAPGGATVHHCHTLHYSRPNNTARQRRAFVISCRVAEPKGNA